MHNSATRQQPVILRASDKDARSEIPARPEKISTSTRATNKLCALSRVRAQHYFTLSLEGCAPCPQDLNHATLLAGTYHHV